MKIVLRSIRDKYDDVGSKKLELAAKYFDFLRKRCIINKDKNSDSFIVDIDYDLFSCKRYIDSFATLFVDSMDYDSFNMAIDCCANGQYYDLICIEDGGLYRLTFYSSLATRVFKDLLYNKKKIFK